ncbi:MAG: TRAP transporter small permease [Desulfurococcaceae archaeon]|jgi:TRAP-type C4-dicarboxylate transport system permease small subunit
MKHVHKMSKTRRALGVFDKVLGFIEEPFTYLGIILVLMLVGVAFSRYFLKYPTPFEEEVSLLLNLWMVCLGMSIVLRTGDHINTPILYDKIVARKRIGRIYRVLIYLVSIGFSALMLYFIYLKFPILTKGRTEYMRFPYAVYYSGLIIAFSFMILRYTIKIVVTLTGETQ